MNYQNNTSSRISRLIIAHLRDNLTIGEKLELDNWLLQSIENRDLFHRLTNSRIIIVTLNQVKAANIPAALKKVKKNLAFKRNNPFGSFFSRILAA